ncbi:MAG: DHHA1 domain-containing protein, partial [Chitinophagaceae bacterium]|nr:DHHA1 domain-containing protein [Chitinophagaceae bacterium]
THAGTTGQLGLFKIKHETAVAAGVRRIEAVAGIMAYNLVQETFSQLHQIKEALKNPKETIKAIESLQTDNSVLKKKMESLETKQLQVIKQGLPGKVQSLGSVNFIGEMVEVSNAESLRKLCADLKPMLNNYVVLLVANIEGKPAVALMLDEGVAASNNTDAITIIKQQVAPLINGGGGGQKLLATAGGQDAGQLSNVIETVKKMFTFSQGQSVER